ncbi:MAG: TVP38/TMEM64 family protein [Spirochaetes bacterium]|nr:TVP38/TMEM64 family protein [Spirochaetota bacterium]
MNKNIIKPIITLILVICIVFLYIYFKESINEQFKNLLSWIKELGFVGILVYSLIYMLATVFLIPGSVLTIGAGIIFGVVRGSIMVSVASTLGATLAFLVGRYFLRNWVEKQIAEKPNFLAVDKAVANEGWKIVGLTRLSPIFPFVFLNYAFGLTRVSLKDYFLASWIGMIPGTIAYVYAGSLIGDLAKIGVTGNQKTLGEWIIYAIGLAATFAVTIYVTKIARKALSQKLDNIQES